MTVDGFHVAPLPLRRGNRWRLAAARFVPTMNGNSSPDAKPRCRYAALHVFCTPTGQESSA